MDGHWIRQNGLTFLELHSGKLGGGESFLTPRSLDRSGGSLPTSLLEMLHALPMLVVQVCQLALKKFVLLLLDDTWRLFFINFNHALHQNSLVAI